MLLKKKKKAVFTTWEPRFLVLDQDKLLFYTDKTKKTLKKTLNIKTDVQTVCFHYDEDAPEQSKKKGMKDIDETRFDIYVKKPYPRKYMMKVENDNMLEADDWVSSIEKALKDHG
jgi:hypothetical protein